MNQLRSIITVLIILMISSPCVSANQITYSFDLYNIWGAHWKDELLFPTGEHIATLIFTGDTDNVFYDDTDPEEERNFTNIPLTGQLYIVQEDTTYYFLPDQTFVINSGFGAWPGSAGHKNGWSVTALDYETNNETKIVWFSQQADGYDYNPDQIDLTIDRSLSYDPSMEATSWGSLKKWDIGQDLYDYEYGVFRIPSEGGDLILLENPLLEDDMLVRAYAQTSVPIPSTVILLSSVLPVLIGVRKKSKTHSQTTNAYKY